MEEQSRRVSREENKCDTRQREERETGWTDKVIYSQTRGMHTSSAEYTTFITFELINRKSGGKATRITVFRKLGNEKEK